MGPPVLIWTRLHDHQERRGRHRLLVGFTTTCTISGYQH